MIGGIAGGDIMKGFNGDDIMLGRGSFTKFIGGLGYDWASYEQATHGIDADLNRKELVAVNGTEDSIRDIYQSHRGPQRLSLRRRPEGNQHHQAAGHERRARQSKSHHRPAEFLRPGSR